MQHGGVYISILHIHLKFLIDVQNQSWCTSANRCTRDSKYATIWERAQVPHGHLWQRNYQWMAHACRSNNCTVSGQKCSISTVRHISQFSTLSRKSWNWRVVKYISSKSSSCDPYRQIYGLLEDQFACSSNSFFWSFLGRLPRDTS